MKGTWRKILLLGASLAMLPISSYAIQPDAAFLELKKRKQVEWAKADKQVDGKLAALEKKFGKKPNIIYILSDDVGWGELGWQGGGKHRGTPTPQLDKMAYEGMRFWTSYSEPSCTPSRIAINTGRHPFRTGLLAVLWPGQTEGLSPEEVTVAEVLSKVGYHTAMWGKWHLGDEEKYAPENQGYDYAYYGLYNGAPDFWPASAEFYDENMPQPMKPAFYDFPGEEKYKELTGIELNPACFVGEKGKGRKPIEGVAGVLGKKRQEAFEKESIKQIKGYINDKAKSDKPFFIYWATYTQQLAGSEEFKQVPHVDHANAQASFMAMHNDHMRQLFDTLKEEGIEENTLVVWWSDNGPMYGFWPTSGYSWLRGGKTDITEGGVRVPAMARWPGMIEPHQDPVDVIHLVDLFTTAARIGGAMEYIPNDRVTDGIDQTPLLLLGEGHSHRNYLFYYSGPELKGIRFQDFKLLMSGKLKGGVPEMQFFNVMRDPGEKFGQFYPGLFTITPMQNMIKGHMMMIKKFPNRVSENMPQGAEITPHD